MSTNSSDHKKAYNQAAKQAEKAAKRLEKLRTRARALEEEVRGAEQEKAGAEQTKGEALEGYAQAVGENPDEEPPEVEATVERADQTIQAAAGRARVAREKLQALKGPIQDAEKELHQAYEEADKARSDYWAAREEEILASLPKGLEPLLEAWWCRQAASGGRFNPDFGGYVVSQARSGRLSVGDPEASKPKAAVPMQRLQDTASGRETGQANTASGAPTMDELEALDGQEEDEGGITVHTD